MPPLTELMSPSPELPDFSWGRGLGSAMGCGDDSCETEPYIHNVMGTFGGVANGRGETYRTGAEYWLDDQ